MLRVLSPTSKSSCNKSGCSELREYSLLIRCNYAGVSYVTYCKTSMPWAGTQDTQHVQILLPKEELFSTYCNNFSQPTTICFAAKQV